MRLVDVAELERDQFVDVADVAVVVNARLGTGEAVFRRRKRRQRLVVDVDRLERVSRGGLVSRDDGRDRIAHETNDFRAEGVFVVADGKDAVRNRKRRAREHQMHARQRFGLRRVDAQ